MTKDGGPAFPRPTSTDEHEHLCNVYQDQSGMSLRDWFAGQALAAFDWKRSDLEDVALECYQMADAMIAEREEA